MDLDTSDRVAMGYTLEVVDMAGVAEETDMYTDIVGVGTTDKWVVLQPIQLRHLGT